MLNYLHSGNNLLRLCQTPIQLMQNHFSTSDRFTSRRKDSKKSTEKKSDIKKSEFNKSIRKKAMNDISGKKDFIFYMLNGRCWMCVEKNFFSI